MVQHTCYAVACQWVQYYYTMVCNVIGGVGGRGVCLATQRPVHESIPLSRLGGLQQAGLFMARKTHNAFCASASTGPWTLREQYPRAPGVQAITNISTHIQKYYNPTRSPGPTLPNNAVDRSA